MEDKDKLELIRR